MTLFITETYFFRPNVQIHQDFVVAEVRIEKRGLLFETHEGS